ncbi:MAG: transposase family protein [Gemmatimonadota bacterium]|nr:transposase family protein [Gemmatimonadota bacterium]
MDFYLPFKKKGKQPLADEQKAFNKALAFVRVTIEHTFGRMNRFGACAEVFRQRRSLHARVVRVIALLVDRQLATRMGAVCLAAA